MNGYHPSSHRLPKKDIATWVVEDGVFLSRNWTTSCSVQNRATNERDWGRIALN